MFAFSRRCLTCWLPRHVFVVEDTIGSRRAHDKELALQRMRQNGAEIVSREMVAFEWLERANTACRMKDCRL